MKRTRHGLIAFAVAAMVAAPAAAQQSTATSPNARWAAWMGCWQVAEESIEDTAQLLAQLGTGTMARSNRSGARVCVTPSADGGATITTLVNDRPVRSETIVADATLRPLNEEGCRGTQKAEWAKSAVRLFARTEVTCADQPQRTVWGLSTMVDGPMWLDIQLIESQGRKSVRVRRYRRAANQEGAAPQARERANLPLGKKLTIAEIVEASSKVPAEVLQAALIDLGNGGYDLKAKQLRELDAVGVPESVIDQMIAMSFPKRFVVEPAGSGGGGGGMFADPWDSSLDMWPYMSMWPYGGMSPYYGYPYNSSFYSSLYSSFYPVYLSPFGYRYWGYFDPTYRYYSDLTGAIVVNPPIGTIDPQPERGAGRVVDGRGYTRIRRTEPETPVRVNSGDHGSSSTASSGSSGSSGSGSSGVSSGGYSSGGGGGERVAVPRPPGSK